MATFQLTEPVVRALVDRLETQLPEVIDELNAEGDVELSVPEEVYPHIPSVGLLRHWPAVGIQQLPTGLEDDIGSSAVARVELAVVAFEADPDLGTLAWKLIRWERALTTVVMAGRQLGVGGVDAYSVSHLGSRPGPTLGDSDDPETVRTYSSWIGVLFRFLREE
jgi:hypothetical protein